MKNIKVTSLKTDRLELRIPTMDEQYHLWEILKDEKVNRLYMPTPSRFNGDRKAFQEKLNDWDKQKEFYELKVNNLDKDDYMFTWSIFLGDEVIGQITVQPKGDDPSVRDIGWFIDPKYQGHGYAYEAARNVLDYMFNEVEITKIVTSAALDNPASWKLMEKLGMKRLQVIESSYLDNEGNHLPGYRYELTKELFEEAKNDNTRKIKSR